MCKQYRTHVAGAYITSPTIRFSTKCKRLLLNYQILINFSAFVLGFAHFNWALMGEITVAVISGNL
jgi:hypothetical protein